MNRRRLQYCERASRITIGFGDDELYSIIVDRQLERSKPMALVLERPVHQLPKIIGRNWLENEHPHSRE